MTAARQVVAAACRASHSSLGSSRTEGMWMDITCGTSHAGEGIHYARWRAAACCFCACMRVRVQACTQEMHSRGCQRCVQASCVCISEVLVPPKTATLGKYETCAFSQATQQGTHLPTSKPGHQYTCNVPKPPLPLSAASHPYTTPARPCRNQSSQS